MSALQDFHPSNKELIASCGMDNSVKIWSLKGMIFWQSLFYKASVWSEKLNEFSYEQSFGCMLRNHLTGKIIHPNSNPNMYSFQWGILLPFPSSCILLYLYWPISPNLWNILLNEAKWILSWNSKISEHLISIMYIPLDWACIRCWASSGLEWVVENDLLMPEMEICVSFTVCTI
jgi:WD40 repeat protein